MKERPFRYTGSSVVMQHEDGKKDKYRVTIRDSDGDEFLWAPSSGGFFAFSHMMAVSEEAEYNGESCYGRLMPMFYTLMCFYSHKAAKDAVRAGKVPDVYQKSYFEEMVDRWGDDIMDMLEEVIG